MRVVETGLWLSGLLLLALFFGARGWSEAASERDIADFRVHPQQPLVANDVAPSMQRGSTTLAPLPDIVAQLLDAKARSAPGKALAVRAGDLVAPAVIAVLRIPRIDLQVPVGIGTDEPVLLRGAGHIAGTAAPGSSGNVAIAAHRDSFFRGLKDVVVGDLIELESAHGVDAYRVASLSVVAPSNVQVLADTGSPALTLVTCFPFHFVGHAPQRFIVSAVPAEFPAQAPRRSP